MTTHLIIHRKTMIPPMFQSNNATTPNAHIGELFNVKLDPVLPIRSIHQAFAFINISGLGTHESDIISDIFTICEYDDGETCFTPDTMLEKLKEIQQLIIDTLVTLAISNPTENTDNLVELNNTLHTLCQHINHWMSKTTDEVYYHVYFG